MSEQIYKNILYKEAEIIDSKLKKIRSILWFFIAVSAIGLFFGFLIIFTSIPWIILYGKGYHESMMIITIIWFVVLLLFMYLSYSYPTAIFIILLLIAVLEVIVAFFRFEHFDLYTISLITIRVCAFVICIYGLIISTRKKQIEYILYHDQIE